MKNLFIVLSILMIFACKADVGKGDKIKVLYLTGGGYHHYSLQEEYVRENLSNSLSFVAMDTFWLSKEKHYFRGLVSTDKLIAPIQEVGQYDVLIFNMCFAKNKEKDFVDGIIKLATKKPTLFIHCTFHTFWDISERKRWTDILGIDSRKHKRKNKLQIHLAEQNSPVVNFMNSPFYFSNSLEELYLGRSYSKDIKVLLKGHDYDDAKPFLPVLWEINRREQKSLHITFPHSHPEFNTATYQAFLVNAVLYLSGKPLPYYQYFSAKHKLLRGRDDKLYSYSLPTFYQEDVRGASPYRHRYKVPSKAKFFVAKFKAVGESDKKEGGLFFKIFVDGQFLFHTSDLFVGHEEKIKIRLPAEAERVEIRVGSYKYFYEKKTASGYGFEILQAGFIN